MQSVHRRLRDAAMMAYNTHSAKRSAEDYVRVTHDSERPHRKPRFDLRNPSALAPDALEDDATLDADVIGSRGQQVRRGAVNIDGYDSDSENENFDVRAATRQQEKDVAQPSKEEEVGDMFADLEEDFADADGSDGDADRSISKRKKAVRFLDEGEIEGQNLSSKSGGHVSADFSLNGGGKGKAKALDNEVDSSSDSEVDDATRAAVGDEVDEELGAGGKKMHAPKLDAFNMRNENDEGRFDEQGNYVRKAADADAIHDIWMEGISKRDMKKAGEAHERREIERRRRAMEDDAKSDSEVLKSLIPLLQPAESILEALARLNKSKKAKTRRQNKHKKSGVDTVDSVESKAEDAQEEERTRMIDTITEAADLLLARGQTDVYDSERETLMRQYQRASGEQWIDEEQSPRQSDSKSWEYRWSDARDGGDIHGPYDDGTMKAWNDAGYFGDGVEFRQIGREIDGWTRIAEFV